MISYLLTNDNLIIQIQGESKPRLLKRSDRTKEILSGIAEVNCQKNKEIQEELLHEFVELITPAKLIEHKSDKRFLISEDGYLFYCEFPEVPIPEFFANKILEFIDADLNIDNLIKFWLNCLDNPRRTAVDELFNFLSYNHYPITDDGCFIGYKKVTSKNDTCYTKDYEGLYIDNQGQVREANGRFATKERKQKYLDAISENEPEFVDSYSRKISQKIGDTVTMPREECDEDRSNTCSRGLHVGSYTYSRSFSGDTLIYVKVNPKNVTAVPTDYKGGKLRCCEYTVLGYGEEDNELSQLLMEGF